MGEKAESFRLSKERCCRAAAWLLLVVVVGGCRSVGYSFKLKGDGTAQILVSDSQIVNHVRALSRDANQQYSNYLQPTFHGSTNSELVRRDRRVDPGTHDPLLVGDAICRRLRPIASFIHLSDAQIKEASVDIEPSIARLYPSADRDREVELYGYATFLATILSINTLERSQADSGPCPAPLPPQFAIHTGDAIDASMFSEVLQFLSIVNELKIPFLNVVGNHDDVFFGTLPPAKMSGFNVVSPFVPVQGHQRFVRSHHPEASSTDISIPHSARDQHEPTNFGLAPDQTTTDFPPSAFHGFDLICAEPAPLALCDEAKGYYSFDYTVQANESSQLRTIRVVVLNTFESSPQSLVGVIKQLSKGRMEDKQFEWLKGILDESEEDQSAVMVFGHHPFASFTGGDGDRLREMLTQAEPVIAYLVGHKHKHEVRRHAREGQDVPLWEILGGVNIAYPQFGVQVELLEDAQNSHTGYLRLRSFEEHLSEAPASCEELSTDSPLPCQARAGREGAKRDAGDEWQEIRTQAINEANGMLAVRLR